jgi:ATP-dependent RNA helicase DeaD
MKSFSELTLSESMMQSLNEMGFETPSPIQAETLPILLGEPTDFLGLAATGTGKTAAFAIPLLEGLDRNSRGVKALILCPTRELALQVAGQIDLLGKHMGVRALAIYGGTGYSEQIHGLKSGVQVVVGTPGRVVDHLEKGTLNLGGLQTLVLDEADEMISMGFKEDLETVLDGAPKGQANIWLFSATMSPEVRGVADAYLNNPQKVAVNRTEMVPSTVSQEFFIVHEYDKPQLVCTLIDAADDFFGIIFCQTKSLVADLTQFLKDRGYNADCLHGDMDQGSRDRVMKNYREKKLSVLIATDVACRGLDVKDVTHVINYSIPREIDNYIHRIGRTGRSGKEGKAISLVTRNTRELMFRIERVTKVRMTEGTLPSGREIALKKVLKAKESFSAKPAESRLTDLLTESWAPVLENLSKEEIVSRFLVLMNPEIVPSAEAPRARPMNDNREARPSRDDRGGPRGGYESRSEGGPRREKPRYQDRGDRGYDEAPRGGYDKKPSYQKREEARFSGKPVKAARAEASFDAPKPRWKKDFAAKKSFEGAPGGAAKPKKKPFGKFAKAERFSATKH